MSLEYGKKSYAKWILAGEHTVLRGGPALVFPFKKYFIEFKYLASDNEFHLQLKSEDSPMEVLFWGIMEKALHLVNKKRNDLKGQLKINPQIPIGGGLGSSSALCVSLIEWFHYLGWVPKDQIFSASRELEHIIHGESSGVDIVGAMSETGQRFLKKGDYDSFPIHWQPNWYLSDCGQKGVTASCIQKVQTLLKKNPDIGAKIDKQMIKSVELAQKSLGLYDEEQGLDILTEAIDLASSCFKQWGLVHGSLKEHMHNLTRNGAISVKPTGSGEGGYVLSLWKRPAPPILKNQLGLIEV